MLKTIITAATVVMLSAGAVLAQGAPLLPGPAAATARPDPSPVGDQAQVFRTCVTTRVSPPLVEASTVAEYERVRFMPGYFYIGTGPHLSSQSNAIPGVVDCLKQVGATRR